MVAILFYSGNLLDLCMGVFDCDGNWISENLLGEPIIEGLTSVELYHGKGSFSKIFFHEISSNLPKGKMNLAIYVKPGFEKGDCQERSSSYIDWKMIKPLIIKNICVLSKKKKQANGDSCD